MARTRHDAALAIELQRRFALALLWGAALVALVFVPWGVYNAFTGNVRGAVSAFALSIGLLLLGWLAFRSARAAVATHDAAGPAATRPDTEP